MGASATEERMRRLTIAFLISCLLGISAGSAVVAQTPSPDPVGVGHRVEVPEMGFAATFPEGWVVEIVEEGSETAILVQSGPERFGPDVELRNLLVARGPEGQEGDRPHGCTLVRYAPIDLTADEFLNEVFEQSDLAVESLHEGLSRVFMNMWWKGHILTDQPEHPYIEQYAIGDDSTVALLWCTGVLSYRGDWLSIAESFEFLPAEE
jgi:hypothetical protein